jgi:hypothetical protein
MMSKPGYRFALFATALAVVVVLLGAYTRLTHAGLGCPDWPGCYGFIGVPMSEHKQTLAESRFPEAPVEVAKGWYEMIHRYFAGVLGLVILGLAVQALRQRSVPGQPLKLPLLLLALVTLQAAFGMWTVTLKLWPQVVTAPGTCDSDCMALVYTARQLHIGLNREASRASHGLALAEPLPESLDATLHREYPQLSRATLDRQRYGQLADPAKGAQLWIVDPHGNLVLRYDTTSPGKAILNDLRHLLKISQIG